MKSSGQWLSCAEAREIDMVDYLAAAGHEPKKIRNNDYWYLSPLRIEKTASFKVNRKLNRWYDHGLGQGGNIIDFAILYFNCTIGEFLQSAQGNFSFHKPTACISSGHHADHPNRVIIKEVKPLHSLVLIRYLHSRCIPLPIAGQFCKEVKFEMSSKPYYSISFLNDLGGYELRNPYCKNSSTPKGITTIKNGAIKLAVFEGFFDFLSFLALHPNGQQLQWDFCILNSLSFFEKTRPFLDQYATIHLFLDNDAAGQNCSRAAVKLDKRYIDESHLYGKYKDLNEWIVAMGKQPGTAFRAPP